MVSISEVQTRARHLEQAVEEGSRTVSGGRHPAACPATLRFLHTLSGRCVSFHRYPVRLNLRRESRYLVNAKPERGTLREALRSGAQLDPIKMVKGLLLVGRVIC